MIAQVIDDDIYSTFTTSAPEILYQSKPREHNPDGIPNTWDRSWTYSLQSYQKAAGKEYNLVINNPRRTKHEITINYWSEFYIQEIIDQFKRIKQYLKEQGIIAYCVAEISRDSYKTEPVNHLHRHFLVDSDSLDLSENLLRDIFKDACRYAGLQPDEPKILDSPDAPKKNCEVKYKRIQYKDKDGNPLTSEESFERKVRYILKYNSYQRTPILFQSGTGINKIASIGNWFITTDGTKASKKDMWNNMIDDWFPESAAERLLQKVIQHLPQVTMEYSGSIHIGDQSYHWGQ